MGYQLLNISTGNGYQFFNQKNLYLISVWSDSLIPGPVYKPGLQPGTRPTLVSAVKSWPVDAETVVHPGSGTTLHEARDDYWLGAGTNERTNERMQSAGTTRSPHPPTKRGPDPGAQR
jgi:hypothetical protein